MNEPVSRQYIFKIQYENGAVNLIEACNFKDALSQLANNENIVSIVRYIKG